MLIAAFPEVAEIGKKVARMLNAEYTTIAVQDFPDSEFHIKLRKNPAHKNVVIISSMTRDPDEKLVETVLAGGIAKDFHANEVTLVATYMPYMRQDKHFERYDSLSDKHIIKMLNGFDKIITIDPHLHRIHSMKELSAKATTISAKMLIADYIKKRFKKDFTIVGPDEESEQWSKPIANALHDKVVVLKKHRFSGTKIKQSNIKEKLSSNVIIIDDIISTGKTIAGALRIAKEHGAKKLYCIGIHGLLVNGADKLITKYAELITTNTIKSKYSRIEVSPIIADALKNN
jgi:ribose-phosphate pyrophosphokinase